MRLGPSCALWGVCLAVLASGCAGTARREGLATGLGNVPSRLLRPGDPIARLGPAPVSMGPLYDPGSYTPAGRPEIAMPGPGPGPVQGMGPGPAQGPGASSGLLTVGGGQLSDRGDATPPADRAGNPAAQPQPQPRAPRQPSTAIASRDASGRGVGASAPDPRTAQPDPRTAQPDPRAAQPGPIDPRPDRQIAGAGAGASAGAGAGAGAGGATPRSASVGQPAARPGGSGPGAGSIRPQASAPEMAASAASRGPRVVLEEVGDRSGEAEDASRSGLPPILAAGIDLETYAAPPTANDPQARLVSTRRPVAALRDAREALLSGLKPEGEAGDPVAEPMPDRGGEPAGPEAAGRPAPSRPEASEVSEGRLPVEARPALGPAVGADAPPDLEPIPRTRDDVRPTAGRPDSPHVADETPGMSVDPAPANGSASPFEQPRLVERLGHRAQRFRDRLTVPWPRAESGEPADGGSALSRATRPRLPRIPRLGGEDDVRWLLPGG